MLSRASSGFEAMAAPPAVTVQFYIAVISPAANLCDFNSLKGQEKII
jgi:hypothetical protein